MPRYDYWAANDYHRIKILRDTKLFRNRLLPDIQGGEVFPAARPQNCDFYYRGRKLFSFDGNAFQSNIAFLAAFENRPTGEVSEARFEELRLVQTFEAAYDQIKCNIELHEQLESGGVSRLCRNHSWHRRGFNGPIGVLDIELQRNSIVGNSRFDLVLFNSNEAKLRFFEVKTIENTEIWPRNGVVKVLGQIERYNTALQNDAHEIVTDYNQYLGVMGNLLIQDNENHASQLPQIENVDDHVDLLIIEFYGDELPELTNIIQQHFGGITCRCHANLQNVSQNTLADWWIR